MAKEFEWIEKVYDMGSSYIHLSDSHIFNAVHKTDEEHTFIVQVGKGKIPIPDEMFLDLIGAFIESTKVVLKYVAGWIYTKDNPEETKYGKE